MLTARNFPHRTVYTTERDQFQLLINCSRCLDRLNMVHLLYKGSVLFNSMQILVRVKQQLENMSISTTTNTSTTTSSSSSSSYSI
jgi:hypothetical protein